MEKFTIEVPDNKVNALVDSLCFKGGWDESSGVSKAKFAKNQILKDLKDTHRAHQRYLVTEASKETIKEAVEIASTYLDGTVVS